MPGEDKLKEIQVTKEISKQTYWLSLAGIGCFIVFVLETFLNGFNLEDAGEIGFLIFILFLPATSLALLIYRKKGGWLLATLVFTIYFYLSLHSMISDLIASEFNYNFPGNLRPALLSVVTLFTPFFLYHKSTRMLLGISPRVAISIAIFATIIAIAIWIIAL